MERRDKRFVIHTLEQRRRARRNFIETQQQALQPEGMSFEQELGLRVLLPDTYNIKLQGKDVQSYVTMVATDFKEPRTEGTAKEKAIKGTRMWGGITLGALAFWALPWSSIALNYTSVLTLSIRTLSTMVPYFALNLPESASQYKSLLQLMSTSILQILSIPVFVGALGVWEVKAHQRYKNRAREIVSQMKEEKIEKSPRVLQKMGNEQAKKEINEKLRVKQRELFAERYPDQLTYMRQLLPNWTENQRIELLQGEVKQLGRQAVKDALVLIGIAFAIPILAFAGGVSLLHGAGMGMGVENNPLLTSIPFVLASLTSTIVRSGLLRLMQSMKNVKTKYTKEKLGKDLLEKYDKTNA